jgi:hypothetical protein
MKSYPQQSTDNRLFAALIAVGLGWAAVSVAWDRASMHQTVASQRNVLQSAQAGGQEAAQRAAKAAVQAAAQAVAPASVF